MAVVITGNNTPTAGGVTYGDGTTYANTAAGAAGGVLYSAGSSAPAFSAAGTTGQYLKSNGASAPTWVTPSGGLTLGTPVDTTSGTSVDYTGLPAGTKQIIVNFVGVSTSDATNIVIQLGTSSGFETTGYLGLMTRLADGSTVSSTNSTNGFAIYSTSAAAILSGSIILTLENSTSNTWCGQGNVGNTASLLAMSVTAARKSLSGVCDRVSIVGAFDAGQVNIAYQ